MSTGPANNISFSNMKQITELEGIYKNLGEGGSDLPPFYLSTVVWPTAKDIKHESIDKIVVSTMDDKVIIVKAFSGEDLIKEENFEGEKDFKLKNGKIHLKQKVSISLAYPSGNPFIGTAYEETVIGIDTQGQGKLRQKAAFAGTVFLFIPLAGGVTDDVRFVKIAK